MRRLVLLLVLILLPMRCGFAAISVVGELSREITVSPGDKIEGTILVKNNGEEVVQARVYKNDYLFFADGRNLYGEPGTTPRSNANWVSLQPTQIDVPPHESAAVYYTIEVPTGTDLVGTLH